MYNKKISTPNSILNVQTYILDDFFEEFSEISSNGAKSNFDRGLNFKNLTYEIKKDKFYFRNITPVCPHCNSKLNDKNGNKHRKLHILHHGKQDCIIQRYKCTSCGKTFYTDMISLVYDNWNVTIPVIEIIEKLYRNYGVGLHKIRQDLKENYMIDISHQTIENILLMLEMNIEYENWSLSGHYLFDSLWVKIKGKWHYLLALFDLGLNTIVSIELVESEDKKTIQKFLTKSLANQKKYSIGTDLKHEYRDAISKMGIKHHFCRFHVKQKINRDIKKYLKENNISEEEKETIQQMKKRIFEMLDCDDIQSAEKIRNEFLNFKKEQSPIIFKILWELTIPYFKNLTYHISDHNIASTNNKIENSFQKIFPKHIKKTMRSIKGTIQRFIMKLKNWNTHNMIQQNHHTF